MYSKIRKIFVFSIFFLGLCITAFFLGSIYLKHFSNHNESIRANVNLSEPKADRTVIIFNSTKVYGLAREMKLFLNSFELGRITTQNLDSSFAKSKLFSRQNSLSFAEFVAKLIDYPKNEIQIVSSQNADLVIIIGSDYKLLKPFKN